MEMFRGLRWKRAFLALVKLLVVLTGLIKAICLLIGAINGL